MSKLKNYCLNITDGEHGSIIDDPNGEYYFLNNNNITDDGIVINPTDRRMSKKEFERINKRTQLSTNDVVIATCGTLGKTQVITDKNINYDFSRSVGIIKTDTKKLLPLFLHYYFKNPHTQKRIEKIAEGAVQKHFYIGAMEDFEVEIPDIGIQKDIISAISSIDEKISNNNVICTDLESMAKLLYDYWFVQFDFPNENGKPYKSSGGKMVWNEELKREIPVGWGVSTLEQYCQFENGDRGSNYPNRDDFIIDGIPFVAGGAIKDNEIDYNEVRYISEEKYNSLRAGKAKKGDVLMTLRGSIAKCVYSPFDRMAIASALVIVRPNNGVSREYLHRVLISEYYTQLLKNYDNGSVQANLSVDTVKSFPMIFPTEIVMDYFTHRIRALEQKETELREENQQLSSLRDFLLPMLMNGQVKVKKGECQ